MVEQRPFKPLVGGSSPPAPTKNPRKFAISARQYTQIHFSFLPYIRTNRTNTHTEETLQISEETEESRIKNGVNNFPLGGNYSPPGGDYFYSGVKIKKEGSTVYLWKNPETVSSVSSSVPPVSPPPPVSRLGVSFDTWS